MIKNICNKYSSIDSEQIGTYHNVMSPVIQKPTQCKSCIYYTSRNCTKEFKDKMSDEHNYFC